MRGTARSQGPRTGGKKHGWTSIVFNTCTSVQQATLMPAAGGAQHRGFLKKKLQSCVSDHEFFAVCCLIVCSGSRRSCVRSKCCRQSGTSTRRLSSGSVLPASCVNLLDSSARGGCLRHMAAWRFGVENWLPKRNGEEEWVYWMMS